MPQVRAKMPDGTIRTFGSREEADMAAELMWQGVKLPDTSAATPATTPTTESNAVQKFLRAGAESLRTPHFTGLTGVFGDMAQLGRNEGANALEALASPRENASTLGALAAQLIPPVRGAATAVRAAGAVPRVASGLQALRSLGSSAWRSALGGGAAAGADAAARGDSANDVANTALGAAAFEGGADLLGGGLMAGASNLMRGTGRQFAYKALAPTDADLANVHLAFRDTPQEFHKAGDRFLAGKARRTLKDILQGEAESMPGLGLGRGVGGIRSAQEAIQRADASDAMQMDIIRRTMDAPLGPGLGPAPKAEYALDLAEVARPVLSRASDTSLLREGADPTTVGTSVRRVVEKFLNRPKDTRVFAPRPGQKMLPEPQVDVKIGDWEAPLNRLPSKLGDLTVPSPSPWATAVSEDVTVPAVAIPNLERGPRVTEELGGDYLGEGLVAQRFRARPGVLTGQRVSDSVAPESGIGYVMASHTPTSVLPTPPHFTGEAARVSEVALQPTAGTVKMALSKAQALYPDLFPKGPTTHNVVGLDVANDIIKAIDRDLNRAMQSRIGKMGAGERYVPTTKEETLMAIRSALRSAVNEKAPMGATLGGEPVSLAEVLKQQRQDIVMRDLKARATGEDVGGLKARTHFNPQTGRPGLSLYENVIRFGGSAANPMMKAGAAGLNNAGTIPSALRLAYLLSSQPSQGEATMRDVNLSGIRR